MKKFKIVAIGKKDAYYPDRKKLIKNIFKITSDYLDYKGNDWFEGIRGEVISGVFKGKHFFLRIRLKEIKS